MKKIKKLLKKQWFANTVALCAAVLFYVILVNLGPIFSGIGSFLGIFSSIFVGVVIAYFVNPVVNFIEDKILAKVQKKSLRHNLAVVISLALIILLIVLLFVALIPSFVESIISFIGNVDTYITNTEDFLDQFASLLATFHMDISDVTSRVTDLVQSVLSELPNRLASIANTSYNVGVGIGNVLLGIIFSIYFLLGKEQLIGSFVMLRDLLIKEDVVKKQAVFWTRCNDILLRYVGYDLLDGLIVGIVNAILMAIFGMPYIALVSVIVGVTNLLPTFGPIIGAVLGGLILVLNNPIQALFFLIMTVVIQTIDGYILKPKLFGNAFDVPAVWTLIAIVVGGKIFGVVGIFLAIPFAAVVAFVFREFIIPRLQERKGIVKPEEQAEEETSKS